MFEFIEFRALLKKCMISLQSLILNLSSLPLLASLGASVEASFPPAAGRRVPDHREVPPSLPWVSHLRGNTYAEVNGWYRCIKDWQNAGNLNVDKTRNYEDPYISYILYTHMKNGYQWKYLQTNMKHMKKHWDLMHGKKIGTSCFSGLLQGLESLVPSHPITMKCPTTKTRCLKISPHAT